MSDSLDVSLDDLFVGASEPTERRRLVPASQDEGLLGRIIAGRYQILQRIGSGGMGRVYKARDLSDAEAESMVAIKVLERRHPDPAFQKRFKLEAAVTSKLRHPNTIQVLDHGTSGDGVMYIVMEFLEGQTLAELLTRVHALPWQRALHIVQQICRSLREAHRLGLVHRDLKPANVMLVPAPDGLDHVKVLDFGLAKKFEEERVQQGEITANGMIVGSPQYMAPEQATGARADPRSDVYSLGVLLYELLCGKPPFQARQYISVLLKHVHDPPPPLDQMLPGLGVPEAVEALVMKCLAKEPGRRFQSMEDVITGIQRAANSSGEELTLPLASTDLVLDETPPPEPRLRGQVLALGLLAFLAAAAVGVFAVTFRDRGPPPSTNTAVTAKPAAATPISTPAAPVSTPAAPERILFEVNSEPPGATVSLRGRVLGTTPFHFAMKPSEDGTARVELEFRLDGYHPLSAMAGGSGPVVTFTQRMQPIPLSQLSRAERRRLARAHKLPPAPDSAPGGAPAASAENTAENAEDSAGDPTYVVAPEQDVLHLPEEGSEEPVRMEPSSERSAATSPKTAPEVIEAKDPVFPREALQARVTGTVTARCRISENGHASGCQVLKGLPFMDQAVITALESSRFRPATVDGKPVADDYTLQVSLNPPR